MEETCGMCKHFRRHCVKPRCKMRRAKTPACGYFQKREEASSQNG